MSNESTGRLYTDLFTKYQRDEVREVANEMAKRISVWTGGKQFKGLKVLDIGCGAGKYSLAFAKLGAKVTSIDLHDTASGIVPRFIKANAMHLPFHDNEFSFTFSSGVLHHTPNPEHAIDEQIRVTKEGGELYIALYRNIPYYWMIYAIRPLRFIIPRCIMERIMHFDVDNIYVPYIHIYTKKELDRLFAGKGLEVKRYFKGKYMHRYVLIKQENQG